MVCGGRESTPGLFSHSRPTHGQANVKVPILVPSFASTSQTDGACSSSYRLLRGPPTAPLLWRHPVPITREACKGKGHGDQTQGHTPLSRVPRHRSSECWSEPFIAGLRPEKECGRAGVAQLQLMRQSHPFPHASSQEACENRSSGAGFPAPLPLTAGAVNFVGDTLSLWMLQRPGLYP